MNPEQAIEIINQILLKVSMPGADHRMANQAIDVLTQLAQSQTIYAKESENEP